MMHKWPLRYTYIYPQNYDFSDKFVGVEFDNNAQNS